MKFSDLEETVSGAIGTSMGDGNGFANGGPGTIKRANFVIKGKKKKKIEESELPPHLAKMFGKDGTQVDTRTDVMKQMRDIVDNKSAMKVEFGDGKQMVDMFTASTLIQIYDKVNSANKEKIVQNVGTIEKFTKLMPKLFNMISKSKTDESVYAINKDDPNNPEVLVSGYGRMSMNGLKADIIRGIEEVLRNAEGDNWETVSYAMYENGVLTAKVEALLNAINELEGIRKKGGTRSRGINKR